MKCGARRGRRREKKRLGEKSRARWGIFHEFYCFIFFDYYSKETDQNTSKVERSVAEYRDDET